MEMRLLLPEGRVEAEEEEEDEEEDMSAAAHSQSEDRDMRNKIRVVAGLRVRRCVLPRTRRW